MKVLPLLSVIFFLMSICELCSSTFIFVVHVKSNTACFHRVLAGKRIARRFVRRSLFCERLEDCQRECGEEKRFVCEGFNYRLDHTGRGKGECELLDLPLHRLDIGRDVYPDRDYDYYERDRNGATTNCRGAPPNPEYGRPLPSDSHRRPADYGPEYDRRPPNYRPYGDTRPPVYDRRPPYHDRPDYDRRPWSEPDRRPTDFDRRRPPDYDRRRPSYGIDYDRRGGKDSEQNIIPDVLCVHID